MTEYPKINHFVTGIIKNLRLSPFVIVEDNGTITGIEADLIQRINEIAGLNIHIAVGKWQQIVEKAEDRKIDGLLVSISHEDRAPFFLFSKSPYNAYKYIFTTTLQIKSMDDLNGKRVAYQRGVMIHETLLKKYPEIIPVPAESSGDLVLLLQRNKVDAVLGGNTFKYFVQERMFGNIHIEYLIPGSKEEVLYSIRKDWPELLSIINKALASISEEEVINAAKKIGIHKFISSLPNGYHYNVKERGVMLSSGQRQLLAFLRAYVSNPSILILDEATSSVDSYSEEMIQVATEKITKGRTSIIIAHRLATIKKADKIIVMDAGKIVEIGTHKELINKENEYYKNLFEVQFLKKEAS